MTWTESAPFGLLKQRLAWLGQRQEVLARNIANADTPGYVPRDLDESDFRRWLQRPGSTLGGPMRLAVTAPTHIAAASGGAGPFTAHEQPDTWEATPNGNAVVLEEQMAKVSETGVAHKLATQLYRKYVGLIRTAAGAKG